MLGRGIRQESIAAIQLKIFIPVGTKIACIIAACLIFCRVGSTLVIGPPLTPNEYKVMACLCDDAQVPYEFVLDTMIGADVCSVE